MKTRKVKKNLRCAGDGQADCAARAAGGGRGLAAAKSFRVDADGQVDVQAIIGTEGIRQYSQSHKPGCTCVMCEAVRLENRRKTKSWSSLQEVLRRNKPITVERQILSFIESHFGSRALIQIAAKLSEETGEVNGEIVRLDLGLKTSTEDLEKEVGDCMIVLSQIAANLGTTLDHLRDKRFAFVRTRTWQKEKGAK